MYKLKYVNEDRNKYVNTWVGAKGQLVAASHYESLGTGVYSLACTTLVEKDIGGFTNVEVMLHVRDADMVWSPPLPTGYYNLQNKPWQCLWLAQTGARQYKVGLNPTVLRSYDSLRVQGHKRLRRNVDFVSAALAYRDGFNSHPVNRALSMIKKRTKNTLVGISRNIALEKIGPATLVVYRCSQVVGIVHDGILRIDNTFTHPDLENLEYQHDSTKELGALYRATAAASPAVGGSRPPAKPDFAALKLRLRD